MTDGRPSGATVENFDLIILGAGISGLVAASILTANNANAIVVDSYEKLGGNHLDCQIGPYSFDIGSLIFQDDSPLLAHFPEILPLYVPINPTWGRLNPQGVVTKYPLSIQDDIIAAGPIEWLRIASSVAAARLLSRRLENARDFAQYWIGAYFVHRSGLGKYLERFYGVAADRIELKFAESRMGWIKEHTQIGRYIDFKSWLMPKAQVPANKQLARPWEGFASLYEGAAKKLKQRGVTFALGSKIERLQKRPDGLFELTCGLRRILAPRVVSTLPLDIVNSLVGNSSSTGLQSVTLISLFYSFSGRRGFIESVLYNFSHSGAWKRLTVYSDFYGPRNDREYFAVEVNAAHVDGSVDVAVDDFRRHTTQNHLFEGDLVLEGSRITDNAYPVYTDGAVERASRIIKELKELGIESIGRQGAFDYQPTARDTTLKAERALAFQYTPAP